MLEAPIPSQDETRANRAFDALLMALSRPGDVQTLPAAGEQTIVDALLDRECRVYCADPTLMPGVLATGAMIAEADAADHVFFGNTIDPATLAQIRVGSDLYPDDGATVIVRAALRSGPRLRLTGPGIEHTKEVSLGGLPSGFWEQRRERIRYPMGFDLFFVDGDRVMGVPRSTQVEVL